MRAFILIGERQTNKGPVPENLYTGLDGVALEKAADAARKSGKFVRISKLVNPTHIPLAVDPTPTTSSGAPKLPERKKFAHPTHPDKARSTPPPPKATPAPAPEPEQPIAVLTSEPETGDEKE